MINESQKTKSAGDVDYTVHGIGYAQQRQTDPRIAHFVELAIGDARTVLNVGAGAGSYESVDRHFIAVEPSSAMRAQRPRHLSPAIRGIAEDLPLDDQSVDASMASVTIHQWSDVDKGISELKRVTRGPIVILTFDGDALDRFWLNHYCPEVIEAERKRYPKIEWLCDRLGGIVDCQAVQIPIDCLDGFTEAFYARPERFLNDSVRRSQSAWTFIPAEDQTRAMKKLANDLESGEWDRQFGFLRRQPSFEGSLHLIISNHR